MILRLGRWSVSISQDVAGDANRNEENRKSERIIAKIAETDKITDIIDRKQLTKLHCGEKKRIFNKKRENQSCILN